MINIFIRNSVALHDNHWCGISIGEGHLHYSENSESIYTCIYSIKIACLTLFSPECLDGGGGDFVNNELLK